MESALSSAALLVAPATSDRLRTQEQWTTTNERLLINWSKDWSRAAAAHTSASRKKRFYERCITIPNTLIPLICTMFTSKHLIAENHIIIVIGLCTVACLNTINMTMRYSEATAGHDNAAYRFTDLISDTQEILSKNVAFRPDPDICILNFKTRSDYIHRIAPDVVITEIGEYSTESE